MLLTMNFCYWSISLHLKHCIFFLTSFFFKLFHLFFFATFHLNCISIQYDDRSYTLLLILWRWFSFVSSFKLDLFIHVLFSPSTFFPFCIAFHDWIWMKIGCIFTIPKYLPFSTLSFHRVFSSNSPCSIPLSIYSWCRELNTSELLLRRCLRSVVQTLPRVWSIWSKWFLDTYWRSFGSISEVKLVFLVVGLSLCRVVLWIIFVSLPLLLITTLYHQEPSICRCWLLMCSVVLYSGESRQKIKSFSRFLDIAYSGLLMVCVFTF